MSFWKKLLRLVAIILVIIAIVIFIYAFLVYAIPGAVAVSGTGLLATIANSWYLLTVIGLGLLAVAAIVSPEGFSEAMARVQEGAEQVVQVVGNVASSIIDKGFEIAFNNPYVLGAAGIALFYFFGRGDKAEDKNAQVPISKEAVPRRLTDTEVREGFTYVYA